MPRAPACTEPSSGLTRTSPWLHPKPGGEHPVVVGGWPTWHGGERRALGRAPVPRCFEVESARPLQADDPRPATSAPFRGARLRAERRVRGRVGQGARCGGPRDGRHTECGGPRARPGRGLLPVHRGGTGDNPGLQCEPRSTGQPGRPLSGPGRAGLTYADQARLRGWLASRARPGGVSHGRCARRLMTRRRLLHHGACDTTPVAWLHAEGLLGPRTTAPPTASTSTTREECGVWGRPAREWRGCRCSNQCRADGVLRVRDLREAGAVRRAGHERGGGGGRGGPVRVHEAGASWCSGCTRRPRARRTATRPSTWPPGRGPADGDGRGRAWRAGKVADLAVVGSARCAPHTSPPPAGGAGLCGGRGSDVEMTIVGGQVVYEQRRCALVDEEAILAEATDRARALVRRAGITPQTGSPLVEGTLAPLLGAGLIRPRARIRRSGGRVGRGGASVVVASGHPVRDEPRDHSARSQDERCQSSG